MELLVKILLESLLTTTLDGEYTLEFDLFVGFYTVVLFVSRDSFRSFENRWECLVCNPST